MTYPAVDLYPSETTFPADRTVSPLVALDGGDASGLFTGTLDGGLALDIDGYRQRVTVTLGTLTLTASDAYGVGWIASTMQGWRGSPPSTIQLNQRTRAAGAWTSSRNLTYRTITVSGVVEGLTSAAVEDALDRLNQAASLSDTILTVTAVDGSSRSCIVARQGEVLADPINATAWQWSVQLVAADPRKFARALTAGTGLPSTSGGLTTPFTAPFVTGAVITSGLIDLTNPGNAGGPVVVRFDGPLVAPSVTHVDSGLTLATNLTLGIGQYVLIDMEGQTVLAQGQASRNQNVTSRGWLPFRPGTNEYAFAASSGTGLMSVAATPAWL